jgi:hypothetical protein
VLICRDAHGCVREQLVSQGRAALQIIHDGSPEGRANAQLATAAPDLLAALRETESQLRAYQDAADDWFGTGGDLPESFRGRNVCANAAIDRARAAIARAE